MSDDIIAATPTMELRFQVRAVEFMGGDTYKMGRVLQQKFTVQRRAEHAGIFFEAEWRDVPEVSQ